MSSLVMGFDYGFKKIGVAVGQTVTRTANSLSILKARNGVPNWQAIETLVTEWQPQLFVVGLPLNMDGTASEMSRRAEKFARQLHGRFNIPFETVDERLSTRAAREESDGEIDHIAARIILETYLSELPDT